MKITLQEEIGMSEKGIDYVNSLEVKDPKHLNCEQDLKDTPKFDPCIYDTIKLFHQEQRRINKQSGIVWCCVFVFLIVFITWYLNK